MRTSPLFPLFLIALLAGCSERESSPGTDAGPPPSMDAGPAGDAGPGAGTDAGPGGGTDAGPEGTDAGPGEGSDAGPGGGTDAGPGGDTDAGPGGDTDAGPAESCPEHDLGSAMGVAVYEGTTVGMGDDVEPECAFGDGEDFALAWTAPRTAMFTFDTQGSAFDTVLAIQLGTCGGADLGCDDDTGAGSQSTVRALLEEGTAIVIVVDGFGGDSGTFTLSITEAPETETTCDDDEDDDRDGDIDCADSDCDDFDGCVETMCADGLDDEGDGDVDCDDADCDGDPACTELDCADGLDNDGDGRIDCDDFDCSDAVGCSETNCADGADDDDDGRIDCDDFDCSGSDACGEVGMCTGGVDDDMDGATDCADSECRCDLACATDTCPDENLGSRTGLVASSDNIGRCSLRTPTSDTCVGDGLGGDVTYRWVAPRAGRWTFDTLGSDFDTVLYVLDGGCGGMELGCNDDDDSGVGFTTQSLITLELTAGQRVTIVVDGYRATSVGDFVLNINPAEGG